MMWQRSDGQEMLVKIFNDKLFAEVGDRQWAIGKKIDNFTVVIYSFFQIARDLMPNPSICCCLLVSFLFWAI
jgi:hypothetical protein